MSSKLKSVRVEINNRDLEVIYTALEDLHKKVDKLSDQSPSFMHNPFFELQDYVDKLRRYILEKKTQHPYTPKETEL